MGRRPLKRSAKAEGSLIQDPPVYMFQGLGCSPIKVICKLGSKHPETVSSISGVGVRALRGPFPSTRGSRRAHLRCTSYCAYDKL
ncbi:hypothetical protein GOBAR_DD15504 [Gossypium barbadense]|nr:hypothetical protein GOBAR_DD15504 [Gossypium barbadense]